MANKLFDFDQNYRKKFPNILGLDEVGRGCCAGPLVVAGVILKENYFNPLIQDSKKITSIEQRDLIAKDILKNCIDFKIIEFSPKQVDKFNPKQASILGMQKIAEALKGNYQLIISDFEKVKVGNEIQQINLVKGDQTSFSVAAASIVAKSYRDKVMAKIAKKYPYFCFNDNQGYCTKKHKLLIKNYGPIVSVHRFSYKCVKDYNI